jgi:hypothetical protein
MGPRAFHRRSVNAGRTHGPSSPSYARRGGAGSPPIPPAQPFGRVYSAVAGSIRPLPGRPQPGHRHLR